MIAVSAVTAAAAAAANQRAHAACMKVVAYYDANPTVAQMQEYAACVQRLYPVASDWDIVILKFVVLAMLLSMALGLVWPMDRGWSGRVLSAAMYPIMVLMASLVSAAVVIGVRFLIT